MEATFQVFALRGYESITPPIRLGGAKPEPERRPANPRWLAALVLMTGLAGALMAVPLAGLAQRRVLVPPVQSPADVRPSADVVVGVRGDPFDVEDRRPTSSRFFERQLAHLRLADPTSLRTYRFVLAKPAFARSAGMVSPPDGETGGEPIVAGFVSLRRGDARGVPLNVTDVAKTAVVAERRTAVVMQEGNTPAAILEAAGMDARQAESASDLLLAAAVADGRPLAAGDVVQIVRAAGDATTEPSRISVARRDVLLGAVGRGDDGVYAPVEQEAEQAAPAPAPATPDDLSGVGAAGGNVSLREGLYTLADQGRLPRPLVDDIVRICGHAVDLEKPAGSGDAVSILFSPETSEGRARPEVAYLSLAADGRTRSFYRFADDDGASADFFDESGRSVTRFLLRKPVPAGRLGDGFGWRIHPILKDRRFHEGVDYAAPYGSPILAAGAGVVEKIDAQWGYGKYVRIKHDQGYETTYAHIAGTPPGLKVGTRVAQGETIAFVGSTGLSTGPHLYYEVRVNGRDVDPLRVKLAAGAVLHGDALAAFEVRKRRVDQLLEDARDGAGLQVAGADR